ncbi:hypothetical protein BJY01DRAFT_91545 [Aspergillus pseudoustus]|uniref:Paramyosin n=1 Tax=Aspergillus pseudoustus TaxID=1810923 RepID=A0ABR4KJN0_9EURO
MDFDLSMSQNPHASRDPRLHRPPLNHRLSHHEAPQRLPSGPLQQSAQLAPEEQNDAPADIFIRGISELVQAAAATAAHQSEKEKLQKKHDTTAELLKKARSAQGFPSTVEFFQNAKNEEDQVLAKIDQKIKENEANYKRLQADLKNRWAATTNSLSADSQEDISQLQKASRSAKDKILDLRDDYGQLRERSRSQDDQLRDLGKSLKGLQDTTRKHQDVLADHASLDKDVKSLRDTTRNQQKGFADYKNHLGVFKNRLDSFFSRIEQLEKGAVPLPQGTAKLEEEMTEDTKKTLNDLTVQFKKLEEKLAIWGEKTGFLSSSYQRISALPDQVNRALQVQQEKLDRLDNSQATLTNLSATVTGLRGEMNHLKNIQSTKDDMLLAQLEQQDVALTSVKTDHDRLSGLLEQLSSRIPTDPVEPKFASLGADVQRLREEFGRQDEGIRNVGVGLQSLEARYNNLSTEPIVHHMLGAFQEMYPQWDPTYKMLARRVEQMEVHSRATSFATEEINQLKIEHATLSQKLGGLLERYAWLSQEEFRQVQTRMDALSEKQNTMDGDLTSRRAADQMLLEEVGRERESLNSRIDLLGQSVETLKSDCAQAKTTNDIEKTDLRSLEIRIAGLEKSSQKLKEQVDALAKPPPSRELFPENGDSTREQTPKMPAPPRSNKPDLLDTAATVKMKRRHPSTVSDDERSPITRSHSQDSLASLTVAQDDVKTKKKKRKRRRFEVEPIEIDD